ncbi:MAG: hypothetical protein EOP89_01430 [Lysobacteraceae bacterium]|nr:MAG: hypothetical protein EOP89_01430 [Xanthomonadaceae bacterium]
MKYDFDLYPRAWQFTGDVKTVTRRRGLFDFGPSVEYQLVFEKRELDQDGEPYFIRIGVTFSDGRAKISDPPAGE